MARGRKVNPDKGRDTLAGLDRTTGLVGFDYVMEHDVPPLSVTADGVLRYDSHPEGPNGWGAILLPGKRGIRSRVTDDERHKRPKVPCPWVRISYCPQWIKDELANRWTVRRVAVPGRRESDPWATHDVFPFDVVIAWFRFLWPEEKEWLAKAVKYLTGFSEGWVQQRPGVGAKINITKEFANRCGAAVVVKLTSDGWPWVEHPNPQKTYGFTVIRGQLDEWEVVG